MFWSVYTWCIHLQNAWNSASVLSLCFSGGRKYTSERKSLALNLCTVATTKEERPDTRRAEKEGKVLYWEKKERERNREREQAYDYTILWPLPPALGSVPILLVSATCQALNYTALGFSLCESSIRKVGEGRLDGGEEGNERGMKKEPQKLNGEGRTKSQDVGKRRRSWVRK